MDYKRGFSFTKPAYRFQKLHFAYKYSVVGYKNCISLYKVASRFTIKFNPPNKRPNEWILYY
jgi:hypothetical protein